MPSRVNDQLSGLNEGSSQMNTWPAAQMSPGPLAGVWIGWECRMDVVAPWWKCGNSLIQMYVIVGRDRLCLILWHVVMPPIVRGQTWIFQPFPVSTVPNTGRNSNYRGLDEDGQCLNLVSIVQATLESSYTDHPGIFPAVLVLVYSWVN